MWRKYLLLMAAVVLCAGAAWYFSESGEQPQGDAVLASAHIHAECREVQDI